MTGSNKVARLYDRAVNELLNFQVYGNSYKFDSLEIEEMRREVVNVATAIKAIELLIYGEKEDTESLGYSL